MSSADSETVRILLNGKPQAVRAGLSVADLLLKWKIRPELVTVELNGTILQKLDYETAELRQGDKVEFVFYMGGGAWA
ncbi:MAG: sulfur carrier protein ThiS [Candidatus Omnitrophica bacterium]|nr:sulfur carrier protein ThiS [Candidatus Omnitrophota bacterium]